MFWTIPLNPKVIPLDEHLQLLQKYMMTSKPDILLIESNVTKDIFVPFSKQIESDRKLIYIKKKENIENQKIENEKLENETIEKQTQERFIPTQNDSLFWCLFLAKYGYKEYINVGSQHGRKELEEKTKIAEFVGKKQNKLSEDLNYKITNVFCQEMVTDLLTKPIMPLSAMYGFCCFYECSFLIINEKEKTYLSFLNKKNPKPFHIFTKQKYSIDLDFSGSLESHILLNHYEKPLRAISTYTKTELEEIAEKINYQVIEKMKKNELYDALLKKLAWITK